ncbi:type 1 glutamine amidotransferase domain-containing protein [Jannaschia sp. CCS1]|uniref:type 1 glutamine amidotransferase domain-containing protein n=1 Tax=Jannaschia sp. (strain CCS1) TaxID=290400 RepID=UPI000053AE8A|nr:type 1 glutamine amidotransferase domain-containing protein [Jannaschia sp. CCS1]ABD56397.1 ThiJ/PfpI [Jannaschia sp. CCS1]
MTDQSKTHVLMLVSNPATSPVTHWPIGFWWAELSHAWIAFNDAGYDITVASPGGGDLAADMWSDPEHESGYAAHDIISLGFKSSPLTAPLLTETPALGTLNMKDYDAIFIVGGQGPMVTMVDDTALHETLAAFYETGKILAAVCHGTCVLLKTKLSGGDLLIKGKTWTGFANSEERYSEHAAGQKIQPFWIEDEARKIEDTNFITGGLLAEFAVRDGNLITGQQQVSSAATARKVIAALGA